MTPDTLRTALAASRHPTPSRPPQTGWTHWMHWDPAEHPDDDWLADVIERVSGRG